MTRGEQHEADGAQAPQRATAAHELPSSLQADAMRAERAAAEERQAAAGEDAPPGAAEAPMEVVEEISLPEELLARPGLRAQLDALIDDLNQQDASDLVIMPLDDSCLQLAGEESAVRIARSRIEGVLANGHSLPSQQPQQPPVANLAATTTSSSCAAATTSVVDSSDESAALSPSWPALPATASLPRGGSSSSADGWASRGGGRSEGSGRGGGASGGAGGNGCWAADGSPAARVRDAGHLSSTVSTVSRVSSVVGGGGRRGGAAGGGAVRAAASAAGSSAEGRTLGESSGANGGVPLNGRGFSGGPALNGSRGASMLRYEALRIDAHVDAAEPAVKAAVVELSEGGRGGGRGGGGAVGGGGGGAGGGCYIVSPHAEKTFEEVRSPALARLR